MDSAEASRLLIEHFTRTDTSARNGSRPHGIKKGKNMTLPDALQLLELFDERDYAQTKPITVER